MKKFIFIMLMCALVTGMTFAQDGSWSISGAGEIGTMLNFAGDKVGKDVIQTNKDATRPTPYTATAVILKDNARIEPLIGANAYHNIQYYGFIGQLTTLNYNKGGFKAGLGFETKRAYGSGGQIIGEVSYSDATRTFQYVQNFNDLLAGRFAPDRLWGHYKFLDGKITLEAAAASRDGNTWFSNDVLAQLFGSGTDVVLREWSRGISWVKSTGAIVKDSDGYVVGGDQSKISYKTGELSGIIGEDDGYGMGFTKTDHHNYLMVNLAPIDGLSLGFFMPSVFVFDKQKNTYEGGTTQNGIEGRQNNVSKDGYYDAQGSNKHVAFVDNALLKTRIGAQFASGPLNVAGQFSLLGRQNKLKASTYKVDINPTKTETLTMLELDRRVEVLADGTEKWTDPNRYIATGLYVGAKYAISDSLNAGLAFQGYFWSQQPELGFGANVGFNSGPIGVNLAAGLFVAVDPTEYLVYPQKKTDVAGQKVTVGSEEWQREFDKGFEWEDDIDADGLNYKIEKGTESLLAVKPGVTFQIIENYLAASLDASLFWKLGIDNRKYADSVFGYEVTPQLFFNVAGTGAATNYYGGLGNAIIVRYKVAGWIDGSEKRASNKSKEAYSDVNNASVFALPMYNAVDITFKWSF